jgi:hypothetical protein
MDMRADDSEFRWPLLPGETVIWSGRPAQGVLFTGRDGLLIPFSLMWGGFAVLWEISVLRAGAPLLFRLWGIPFVLVGIYFIAGRFAIDAWLRGDTRYAVTDRRILIARSGPWRGFTALGLDRLPDVRLSLRGDGRGTLRFGQPASMFWSRQSFGAWSPALDPTPQFIAIDDAQGVFDQIQRAIGKLRG